MSGENKPQMSYLDMSDEDLLNSGPPTATTEEATTTVTTTPPASDDGAGEQVPKGIESQTTVDPDDDDDGGGDQTGAAPETEPANEGGEEPPEVKATVEEGETKTTEKPTVEETTIDYKAQYETLLAPFKANGREMTVSSVEDARALMQMGANYNKKMAALKPNLKLLKMLENSDFLSEEKISFLIDLGKKDPAAISKLVKDSGLDPMDLGAEKASEYRPTVHTVADREIDLDTVLDEIQETPTYTRTLDIVSTKWDGASKQTIANSPQLLKVINDHVSTGVYDLISAEIEKERVFGRLNGLTDIDAYRQVGDAIQARGGFNHLFKQNTGKTTPTAPVVVPPKPKVDDKALNDKRRAAGSTKPAAPASTPKDFNPLAMSDEEFSKQGLAKFL